MGLVIGGVIGPALLVMDHERPYRGIFLILMSTVFVAYAAYAWFQLPRDRRNWKSIKGSSLMNERRD